LHRAVFKNLNMQMYSIVLLIVLVVKANDVGDCCSGHENTVDGCDQCPYGYEPTTASNACWWLSLVPFSDWGWKCRALLSDVDQTALEDWLISVHLAQLPSLKRFYEEEGTGANTFVNRVTDLAQLGYLLETSISTENFVTIDTGDYAAQTISWYYAKHDGNKQLVITFHGSSELEDYTQTNIPAVLNIGGDKCLDFSGSSYCGPEPIIEDYERGRTQLQNEIFSILDESCNEDCISVIRVTGHSLRGAHAAYFALELIERYGSAYEVWLSTFASLKPLSESSSDQAQTLFDAGNHRHFRYMVNGDIVPRYPSSSKHFGDAIFIDDGHLMTKSRDYVPDDHDAEDCLPLGIDSIDCLLSHHTMDDYIAGAVLTKSYYFDGGLIEYTGPTKTCPCDSTEISETITFQLQGVSGSEKVTIYSGVTSETVTLSTDWMDFTTTEKSLIISFLNDDSGNDVSFQSDVAASIRSDALWPGWNCDSDNENTRCESVRSGSFNWESDYQIVFEESGHSFEELYTNSKTTCDNSQKLSQPCNSGSPCTEDVCQQRCIDNSSCTHAFSNVNGGCFIYSSCTATRTASVTGTTYSLNRGVSSRRRQLTSRLLRI